MRLQITIKNDAIQYEDLGQMKLSECILHIDNSASFCSIRGDVAFQMIEDQLIKEGSLVPRKYATQEPLQ